MKNESLPRVADLINPTLQALRHLGGVGSIEELQGSVAQVMELSEAQLQATYTNHGREYSRINNLIDWAKVYLGSAGYIEQLDSGQWALTEKGRLAEVVDARAIMSQARAVHNR